MKIAKKILIGLVLLVLLAVFFYWQNNDLVVGAHEVDLSLDDEITIVQLSDLHSKTFGDGNKRLIEEVKSLEPTMIVITGDLIDQKETSITSQLDYIEDLTKLAPVYVVSGNHEYWADLVDEVKEKVVELGAVYLDDQAINLSVNGHFFQLIGLNDAASENDVEDTLSALINKDMYNIVLYHRATMLDVFVDYDVELAFTGHAHGGQFRLPFIGGVISPDQGLFPEYDAGSFTIEDTVMIVSRGLGNSIIPFRVLNRPELVVVRLK